MYIYKICHLFFLTVPFKDDNIMVLNFIMEKLYTYQLRFAVGYAAGNGYTHGSENIKKRSRQ